MIKLITALLQLVLMWLGNKTQRNGVVKRAKDKALKEGFNAIKNRDSTSLMFALDELNRLHKE